MPVVGTAGHVDHGKSALVERLSGRDPDRWDEEKRRGLTIDLGFAWTTLPSGAEVSFVDVPGHERYLKNMLAGIEAIDVALFVVAADQGWMPQSEEHLAILDLLDVTTGVVALTKADTVDDDLLEVAILDISEKLQGTSLENAEIIPVSSTVGTNLDTLIEVLDSQAKMVDVPDRSRPRLWVDRAFAATGSGTVVTGTLLEGSLTTGDSIMLYPGGIGARIRGIQSHEQDRDLAVPGTRVALNLSGVDHAVISRGDMVGQDSEWVLASRFLVELKRTRYADGIGKRGAYHLHLGSAVTAMSVIGVRDSFAVVQIRSPLPAQAGDRFIVRDTGRELVVAGGRILDPQVSETRKALDAAHLINLSGVDETATSLLATRRIIESDHLRILSGGGRPAEGISIGPWVTTREHLDGIEARMINTVTRYHREHPLRIGMPLATLSEHLRVRPEIVECVVDGGETFTRVDHEVALVTHEVNLDTATEMRWGEARARLGADLAVPAESDLGVSPELIHLKQRAGELVRIGPGLVYLREQVDEIVEILRDLEDDFTVAALRDATGLSRKYVVPILEWTDREGLTTRRGNTRRAR